MWHQLVQLVGAAAGTETDSESAAAEGRTWVAARVNLGPQRIRRVATKSKQGKAGFAAPWLVGNGELNNNHNHSISNNIVGRAGGE